MKKSERGLRKNTGVRERSLWSRPLGEGSRDAGCGWAWGSRGQPWVEQDWSADQSWKDPRKWAGLNWENDSNVSFLSLLRFEIYQDPSRLRKLPEHFPRLLPSYPCLSRGLWSHLHLRKAAGKGKSGYSLKGAVLTFERWRGPLRSHPDYRPLPFPNREPTSTPAAASSQRIDSILPRPRKYQSFGLAAMTAGLSFLKGKIRKYV